MLFSPKLFFELIFPQKSAASHIITLNMWHDHYSVHIFNLFRRTEFYTDGLNLMYIFMLHTLFFAPETNTIFLIYSP